MICLFIKNISLKRKKAMNSHIMEFQRKLTNYFLGHSLLPSSLFWNTKSKCLADAFLHQTCGNSRQLDYATLRSTNVLMFSGIQAEPLQLSLISCKNWKSDEYCTYLWPQKYIKANLIDTPANCITMGADVTEFDLL